MWLRANILVSRATDSSTRVIFPPGSGAETLKVLKQAAGAGRSVFGCFEGPGPAGPEAICSTPVDLDQSSQSIGGFSRSPHSLGQRSLALAGNELLEQRTWTKFLPRMIRERLPESCLSNDSGE